MQSSTTQNDWLYAEFEGLYFIYQYNHNVYIVTPVNTVNSIRQFKHKITNTH